MIYNVLTKHRVHILYANAFFFLSEDFLIYKMGSCYTCNHIAHLWISIYGVLDMRVIQDCNDWLQNCC